jgi:ferredoxin like protein
MLKIDDLLLGTRFNVDEIPHIVLNGNACTECDARNCIAICPAGCFKRSAGNEMTFSHASCLECGSCRIVCTRGAVSWKYPRGGYGVCYCLS